MKKEHFGYVSEHFNLVRYSGANDPECWRDNVDPLIIISTAFVEEMPNTIQWKICAYTYLDYDHHDFPWTVFEKIPTEKLANEIVKYLKDTEIMFV